MHSRWYDSDWFKTLERWWDVASSVLVMACGPYIIGSVIADSSALNWFNTILWAIVATWIAWSAFSSWRTRNDTPRVHTSPTDVPLRDVQRIVDSEPEKVPAVKALREIYPGLGLIDAAHLIDAARGAGGPGNGRNNGNGL
ncbi:hypothetical protein [Williamsia muralis]|uniref:hypothetical protein n=1 Tax=Williamsia marianensis TaxID=85044 RepID=UPI003821F94D